MISKDNPFKVPEGYFEQLEKRLNQKAKTKHVSTPRWLKYVSVVLAIGVLTFAGWLIVFGDSSLDFKSNPTFAFLFGSDEQEKSDSLAEANRKAEQIAWHNYTEQMKKEADEIVFSEEELDYLAEITEEAEEELLLTNTDM